MILLELIFELGYEILTLLDAAHVVVQQRGHTINILHLLVETRQR